LGFQFLFLLYFFWTGCDGVDEDDKGSENEDLEEVVDFFFGITGFHLELDDEDDVVDEDEDEEEEALFGLWTLIKLVTFFTALTNLGCSFICLPSF
jgi:hypothetical protein